MLYLLSEGWYFYNFPTVIKYKYLCSAITENIFGKILSYRDIYIYIHLIFLPTSGYYHNLYKNVLICCRVLSDLLTPNSFITMQEVEYIISIEFLRSYMDCHIGLKSNVFSVTYFRFYMKKICSSANIWRWFQWRKTRGLFPASWQKYIFFLSADCFKPTRIL